MAAPPQRLTAHDRDASFGASQNVCDQVADRCTELFGARVGCIGAERLHLPPRIGTFDVWGHATPSPESRLPPVGDAAGGQPVLDLLLSHVGVTSTARESSHVHDQADVSIARQRHQLRLGTLRRARG